MLPVSTNHRLSVSSLSDRLRHRFLLVNLPQIYHSYAAVSSVFRLNSRLFFHLLGSLGRVDAAGACKTEALGRFLAHFVLENLACCIHREAVDKVDVARDFMPGQ